MEHQVGGVNREDSMQRGHVADGRAPERQSVNISEGALPGLPRSQLDHHNDHHAALRRLPDIGGARGLYRGGHLPSGKPGYANSNAEILSYQRASGLEPKPDYYSHGLNRAKSKDHLLNQR